MPPTNSDCADIFQSGDIVTYHGSMLPQIAGLRLVVLLAHVRSGFGDPATDDVCIVCREGGGFEYRVNSNNLRRA